jgi:hypothetical protein
VEGYGGDVYTLLGSRGAEVSREYVLLGVRCVAANAYAFDRSVFAQADSAHHDPVLRDSLRGHSLRVLREFTLPSTDVI